MGALANIENDPAFGHALWLFLISITVQLMILFASSGTELPTAKAFGYALLVAAVAALTGFGLARGWSASAANGTATLPPPTPPPIVQVPKVGP